jgi:drug/metabolite transporter (DMT)-like permease
MLKILFLRAYFILKEKISKSLILGIIIAIFGSLLIGISDLRVEGNFLYGDLLALGGAVMIAAYFLIASKLRKDLSLIPYVSVVYSITTFFLYIFVKLKGYSLITYDLNDYIIFLLLAIGPNVIGHSSLNWALKYLSPSIVSASILGEPVGSTVLAFLILHEVPPFGTLIGGILILIGIYIVSQKDSF